MLPHTNSKVPDVLFIIMSGEYTNDDAYYRVIEYITQKHSWGGYGFFPYELDTIVQLFTYTKEISSFKGERKLWHFSLTFTKSFPPRLLFQLANQLALCFASHYQIVFGIDTHGTNHIHFCVNAFSYKKGIPPLSKNFLERIFPVLESYVLQSLPGIHSADHYFK